MNLNIFPSQFTIDEQINNEEYYDQDPFSCDRVFFNSTTQDRATRYYHQQLCQLPNQYDRIQEDRNKYSYEGEVESGFKLSVWKKVDDDELCGSKNIVKWMPSNIRVKKADRDSATVDVTLKINCSSSLNNQKPHPSSSTLENVSSNNISYNTPIRVCSDCNTTKTPLWRSGPKGPKSLCNACGIRQRKARRAMAAAAAATTNQPPPIKIIKVQQQKEKNIRQNGHASKFKKRCKMSANASGSSSSNGQKKLNLEDFLINLSKNLAFQRVFPEDEKDAAILLMALSSGLVHS